MLREVLIFEKNRKEGMIRTVLCFSFDFTREKRVQHHAAYNEKSTYVQDTKQEKPSG